MNLIEVSDEFNRIKPDPQDAMTLLKKREKMIEWQMAQIRDVVQDLMSKIQGKSINSGWDSDNPNDPVQKEKIDAQIAQGYIAVMKSRFGDEEKDLRVDSYVPDVPGNREIVRRLEAAWQRERRLENMRRDIPTQVRKAKGRLSTWKRKQPNYVSLDTGRDVTKELADALVKYLTDMKLPVRLLRQFFWKKNKMAIIEISTTLTWPWTDGVKPWEVVDQKIKPAVDQYLKDHGYNKVRLSSFYDKAGGSKQSIIKLQIDDEEARDINKAEDTDEIE